MFLFEGANIIRRWGSGDDVVGCVWGIPRRYRDIPLGSARVPSSRFLGLVTSGLSNLKRRISFVFRGFFRLHCLMGLKMILFFCMFACTIERGDEEASTSQAGTPRETPIVSSLVVVMSIKEQTSD